MEDKATKAVIFHYQELDSRDLPRKQRLSLSFTLIKTNNKTYIWLENAVGEF